MEILSAEFVVSNTKVEKCPQDNLPEYAFIGRSNVGKSSLINMLAKRPKLAMTSSTPGKTLLINHFLINKEWYLVDLPGYGYASRGKKQVEKIQQIIEDYILEREQMTNLFVLIDCRLEPQKIDLEFMEWLGENGVPFSIIFTKADKLTNGKVKDNVNKYLKKLTEQWEELPPHFVSSSEKKTGRQEILDYIDSINQSRLLRTQMTQMTQIYTRSYLCHLRHLHSVPANAQSFMVFTLPGITVRCTVPLHSISTFWYLASTTTFPSRAIIPHWQAFSS